MNRITIINIISYIVYLYILYTIFQTTEGELMWLLMSIVALMGIQMGTMWGIVEYYIR